MKMHTFPSYQLRKENTNGQTENNPNTITLDEEEEDYDPTNDIDYMFPNLLSLMQECLASNSEPTKFLTALSNIETQLGNPNVPTNSVIMQQLQELMPTEVVKAISSELKTLTHSDLKDLKSIDITKENKPLPYTQRIQLIFKDSEEE